MRNPNSTRPYQHVLEPVCGYLLLAQKQYEIPSLAGCYNIGPEEQDCWTTGDLVSLFCETWNVKTGGSMTWKNVSVDGPHEANFLKLDCSKIKSVLGWKPIWGVRHAMEKIVEWSALYLSGGNVRGCMDEQIAEYLKG